MQQNCKKLSRLRFSTIARRKTISSENFRPENVKPSTSANSDSWITESEAPFSHASQLRSIQPCMPRKKRNGERGRGEKGREKEENKGWKISFAGKWMWILHCRTTRKFLLAIRIAKREHERNTNESVNGDWIWQTTPKIEEMIQSRNLSPTSGLSSF